MLNRSGGWSGLLTVCAIRSEQRRHGRRLLGWLRLPPSTARQLTWWRPSCTPGTCCAWDVAGQVRAAYPLSAVATPHLVQISGGPRVHAMRAIEALGIPAMLGTGVTITSAGPRTGEPVTVTVAAGGLEAAWEPATTVVFTGQHASCTPGSGPGTGPAVAAADLCCGYTSFFTSRASATAWAHAHREVTGQVLDQASAWQSGT
jgi:alkylmercury lyase-like protein